MSVGPKKSSLGWFIVAKLQKKKKSNENGKKKQFNSYATLNI